MVLQSLQRPLRRNEKHSEGRPDLADLPFFSPFDSTPDSAICRPCKKKRQVVFFQSPRCACFVFVFLDFLTEAAATSIIIPLQCSQPTAVPVQTQEPALVATRCERTRVTGMQAATGGRRCGWGPIRRSRQALADVPLPLSGVQLGSGFPKACS